MQAYEPEMRQILDSIWAAFVGMELGHRSTCDTASGVPLMAAAVSISGAFDGTVVLECSAELARRVTVLAYGMPDDAVQGTQIRDVLGEIANMAGGNIKGLLPEPSSLSLPTVTDGGRERLAGGDLGVLSRVAFECAGEPLCVVLYAGQ